MYTKEQFAKDWKHFLNHINFAQSNLDADSIRFMNEGPSAIMKVLDCHDDLLAACEDVQLELGLLLGLAGLETDKELQNIKVVVVERRIKQVKAAIAKAEP